MNRRVTSNKPSISTKNGPFGEQPFLLSESPLAIQRSIQERRPDFTPEWDAVSKDAGHAFTELFAHQFTAVTRRANRLPEKARLEYLDIAGVTSSIPKPAAGIVRFEVADAATQSVSVPKGFQVGANPANEEEDLVVFETQDSLMATSAKIALIAHQGNRELTPENKPEGRFFPLGTSPRVGDAMLIGLELPAGANITGSISFAVHIAEASGNPHPVSSSQSNSSSSAVVRWQAAYGGAFRDLEVRDDETNHLLRSGIIQLNLDQPLTLSQLPGQEKQLVWIRLQLVQGQFQRPPVLSFIEPNAVRVLAVETIREEVLIPRDHRVGQVFQLSRAPVNALPSTMEILSDESVLAADGMSDEVKTQTWKMVENFDDAISTDRVFTLDPESGVVTFGDGVHGAKPPSGFRRLRAARYQVLRGSASAVGKEEINVLLNSVPYLNSVSNTQAVAGGQDSNILSSRVRRGSLKIRSRDRAVAREDYRLTAETAPGADVARVHAIPGYHPRHAGKRMPGVVGVLVVSNKRDGERPIPDEPTLRAIASHLVRGKNVPVGVEVIAAAPKLRELRAQIRFVPFDGDDLVKRASELEKRLNSFIDPVEGGREGTGWPFGGPLAFSELINTLLTEASGKQVVRSISIRIFVDGLLQTDCKDILIGEDELFWPANHQVVPSMNEVQA